MPHHLRAHIRRLPTMMRFAPGLILAGPLLSLAAYLVAGEQGLIVGVLLLSLLAVAASSVLMRPAEGTVAATCSRAQFLADLDRFLMASDVGGQGTGCIVLQFDDTATLLDRHGRATQTDVIRRIADRLSGALRAGDSILPLDGGGYAVALAPSRRMDLETVVQIASRLQASAAEPIAIGERRFLLSCSAGLCLGSRIGRPTAAALLDAAQVAADEARRNGPGALRAYAPGMARKHADRDAHRAELEVALDEGQIRAWFQPQISADSGEITGFEALARWHHPDRGLMAPQDFLPGIAEAGLSERLSEVMLFNTLVAIARWDKAGLRVPSVGVNFSADELRNPRLADKLKWELDRFDLSPDRLSIEVLETVMTTGDADVAVRNITALARLGCRIDLDDFGTGHTSIANIRRFTVHRLKIDRSFIARIDEDREQQRIVAAVLSMAERLGLDTLAEGVETSGEYTLLAQLGCGHVQGFGIARPMPFEQTMDWIVAHNARQNVLWQTSGTHKG